MTRDKQKILAQVREKAKKRRLFLSHALRQMSRPDRMISAAEVRSVIDRGEVIEDYPEDSRGHSCLIFGRGQGGRHLHVLCSPKEDYLAIITAYLPARHEWSDDFKERKKS